MGWKAKWGTACGESGFSRSVDASAEHFYGLRDACLTGLFLFGFGDPAQYSWRWVLLSFSKTGAVVLS